MVLDNRFIYQASLTQLYTLWVPKTLTYITCDKIIRKKTGDLKVSIYKGMTQFYKFPYCFKNTVPMIRSLR